MALRRSQACDVQIAYLSRIPFGRPCRLVRRLQFLNSASAGPFVMDWNRNGGQFEATRRGLAVRRSVVSEYPLCHEG